MEQTRVTSPMAWREHSTWKQENAWKSWSKPIPHPGGLKLGQLLGWLRVKRHHRPPRSPQLINHWGWGSWLPHVGSKSPVGDQREGQCSWQNWRSGLWWLVHLVSRWSCTLGMYSWGTSSCLKPCMVGAKSLAQGSATPLATTPSRSCPLRPTVLPQLTSRICSTHPLAPPYILLSSQVNPGNHVITHWLEITANLSCVGDNRIFYPLGWTKQKTGPRIWLQLI